MKLFLYVMMSAVMLSAASCKKSEPIKAVAQQPNLRTNDPVCQPFGWAKLIKHGDHERWSVESQSIVVDEGNVYAVVFLADGSNIDIDPGPGEQLVNGPARTVVKLDASGNLLWAKAFTGQFLPINLVIDAQHNVYLSSITRPMISTTPSKIFTAKYTSAGSMVWYKTIDLPLNTGTAPPYETFLGVDAQQNVYTAGYFKNYGTDFDPGPGHVFIGFTGSPNFFVQVLNSNGDFVTVRNGGEVKVKTFSVGGNGDIYTTYSQNKLPNVVYFAKKVFNGATIKTLVYDGAQGDDVLKEARDAAGNTYIFYHRRLIKINAAGVIQWNNDLGGAYKAAMTVDPAGNTYLATDYDYPIDSRLVKINTSGNLVYNKPYFNTKVGFDGLPYNRHTVLNVADIKVKQGKIYLTGKFYGMVDFDPGQGLGILYGIPGDIPIALNLYIVQNNLCE
ncbi:MAG: hypothetical protein EOP47_24555 [Sphingobacteriaceae bacterium]|nr:MAG: hypothetical protein EOP47_24555 [Sphingobacteriaceae bacterium]